MWRTEHLPWQRIKVMLSGRPASVLVRTVTVLSRTALIRCVCDVNSVLYQINKKSALLLLTYIYSGNGSIASEEAAKPFGLK